MPATQASTLHDGSFGPLSGSVRRRHLHREGSLRRRRLHGGAGEPRPRERGAVARSLRRSLRENGAGLGHRGRGRLSVERARARAAPAPVGPRRLADPAVAVPVSCRRGTGLARNPPAAHLALEDSRQPETQPRRAGDRVVHSRLDVPAGQSNGLDAGDAGRADLLSVRSGSWKSWPARGPGSPGPCCCAT